MQGRTKQVKKLQRSGSFDGSQQLLASRLMQEAVEESEKDPAPHKKERGYCKGT